MSIDDVTKAAFEKHLAQWKQHCDDVAHSSRPSDYVDCDAYRSLVQMGKSILPLVKTEYSGTDDQAFFSIAGWAQMIREITGEEVDVPTREWGRIEKIRDRYVRFLDSYLV
jgi:hypothetical protein